MVKEVTKAMEKEGKHYTGAAGSAGVFFWFAGWLFTIAFANLVWWKIILAIVVWPFYLGDVVLAG